MSLDMPERHLNSNLHHCRQPQGSNTAANHCENVAEYAIAIANELGRSEEEKGHLRCAAMLHDLGKIGIPEKLFLIESSKMTEQEKELYFKHPEEGQGFIRFINKLDHVETQVLLPLYEAYSQTKDIEQINTVSATDAATREIE